MLDKKVNRDRRPGEVFIRSVAIQNFCRACMGWDADGAGSMAQAVKACTAPNCHLYPWRNGKEDTNA